MKRQIIKLSEEQLKELNEAKASRECSGNEVKRILAILLIDRNADEELIKSITGYNKNTHPL